MSPVVEIFLLTVLVATTGLSLAYCVSHWDAIAVRIIQRFRIPVCRVAIGIAILITEYPEQWSATQHEMSHRDVGSIWTSNNIPGLHITTTMGTWTPTTIERRIIYEAVDWRLRRYIKDRIQIAMVKNLRATGDVQSIMPP
jgi:hypothetical protein